MNCSFLILLFSILFVLDVYAFTVDVINVTECSYSEDELGELTWDIGSEETVDQLFSGTLEIPLELDNDAYVFYESHYWDTEDEEWVFLFAGIRAFCTSIMMSLPYKKFSTSVEPNWPEYCPIPAGKYDLKNFPISGQYAVLSDIRNIPSLGKHELRLWQDDDLILCRIVYTSSND